MKAIAPLATLTLMLSAAPAVAAQSPLIDGYARPGANEQAATAPSVAAVKGDGQGLVPAANASGSNPKTTDASLPAAPSASRTQQASGGTLPFTGLDVGMVAMAGTLLLGLGLLTRRFATHYDG